MRNFSRILWGIVFIGIGIIVIMVVGWFLVFAGNFCARFSKTKKLWNKLTESNQLMEMIDLIRLTSMISLLLKNGQDLESALARGEEFVKQKCTR